MIIKRYINGGINANTPTEEAEIIRLTNILSILPLGIYIFYIWYGTYLDSLFFTWHSVFFSCTTSIGIYLNYKTKYALAKIFVFLSCSMGTTTAHHIFNDDGSTMITYFFSIIFCIPIFFTFNKEKYAYVIVLGVTCLCLFFSLAMPGQYFYGIVLDKEIRDLSNKIHLTVAFSFAILAMLILHSHWSRSNKRLMMEREKAETAFKKLKQAQTHIIQSEKMASLGVLLAGISHEINNPLNFIQGGVLELKKKITIDLKNKGGYNKYFDILTEGTNRIIEIVKSLNHFNHKSDKEINCDINTIIHGCLTILNHSIKGRIQIEKELEKNLTVLGNSGQLHQVFLNLFVNAIHAIENTGTISISSYLKDNHAFIQIRDTGEGITKEDLENIFDPFFTTKDPGVGTGLGLAISYKIIEEHSGTIVFSSERNIGTKVTIQLPSSH